MAHKQLVCLFSFFFKSKLSSLLRDAAAATHSYPINAASLCGREEEEEEEERPRPSLFMSSLASADLASRQLPVLSPRAPNQK